MLRFAGIALAGLAFVAACTSAPSTRPSPSAALSVEATNVGFDQATYRFKPSTFEAPAGVTIAVVNTGDTDHTFTIAGSAVNILVSPGQTVTGKLALAPGTYQFYCALREPGFTHAQAGMTGTLTVTAAP